MLELHTTPMRYPTFPPTTNKSHQLEQMQLRLTNLVIRLLEKSNETIDDQVLDYIKQLTPSELTEEIHHVTIRLQS